MNIRISTWSIRKVMVFFVYLAAHSTLAHAQGLPAATRTVFKCEVSGKMVYSDSPCLGAIKIEVEPTRGLNKSSGRETVGADVSREKYREAFADAIRPITGMNAKQLDMEGRRQRLQPESKLECRQLDSVLPKVEAEEKLASKEALSTVQVRLFTLRQRFRELRC